jgi:hypothetical protein
MITLSGVEGIVKSNDTTPQYWAEVIMYHDGEGWAAVAGF